MSFTTKLFIFVFIILVSHLFVASTAEENEKQNQKISLYESLYDAIVMDSEIEVTQFIAFGADIDYRYQSEKGKTPLMIAATIGSIGAVRTLIKLGANTNLKSDENLTAIDYALKNDNQFIVTIIEASTPTKFTASNKIQTRNIQLLLVKLDYKPGPIDGIFGSRTKRALSKFAQKSKQSFRIEVSDRQIAALKSALYDQIANENSVPNQQANIDNDTEKNIVVSNSENESLEVTIDDASSEKSVIDNPENQQMVALLETSEDTTKKDLTKSIGKYPDITGIYNAKTKAVFSECGEYNQTIEYIAEESISKLEKNGKFIISYSAPLLKCKGKGKFTNNEKNIKGDYNCTYETATGFKGTLRMKIKGSLEENELRMNYSGRDTSPGVTCNYDWERTLTLN